MQTQIQHLYNQRDLGHGAAATILHPAVLVAMLVAIALILWRPRKFAIASLFLSVFLIPRWEVVVVAGLHFYIRLIIILAGFILVIRARFAIAGGLNSIDKLFMVWVLYRAFAVTVTNWPVGVLEQIYICLQAYCGYFLLRYLIRSEEDIRRAAKALAITAAILGVCMVYEQISHTNPFDALFGGMPTSTEMRNGTVRAEATFGHAILAGCFGATLVPLYFWLWKKKERAFALVGFIGSTLMVLTSNSSTPVLAYVGGILALFLWPLRRHMRLIRWGIVAGLAALAIVMKSPVWWVISHINVIGGSGGYDRAFLIDSCVRHFKDWWLIGTNQNGNWGYDMWDLSDQFVAEAESGGLFTLVCFIAIISLGFRRLGIMMKRVEPRMQWLFWCLGSVMLAHIFAYFGVAYFDQSEIWWFAFLAMIGAATIPLSHPAIAQTATAPAETKFPQFAEVASAWAEPQAVPAHDSSPQGHWMWEQ